MLSVMDHITSEGFRQITPELELIFVEGPLQGKHVVL